MADEGMRPGLLLTGRWFGGREGSKGGFYGQLDCGGLSPEDVSSLHPEVVEALQRLVVGGLVSLRVAPRLYQGQISWGVSEVVSYQPALTTTAAATAKGAS